MTILLDFSPYTLNIFLLFWHHLRSVFFTAVSSFIPRLASSERREELPVWPIGPFCQPAWAARRWACACRYLDGVCFSVAPKWQIPAKMAKLCPIFSLLEVYLIMPWLDKWNFETLQNIICKKGSNVTEIACFVNYSHSLLAVQAHLQFWCKK